MTTDNRLWVALIAGVAFITGTFLLGNAYKYKFRQQQTVLVTGLAETNFESDLIVWDGSYNRQ